MNSKIDTKFIKILLIEDNPDTKLLLQDELLSDNGNIEYSLQCVERLSMGIEYINNNEGLDVILLDLLLPDSQGMDTLSRIQSVTQDIPVIVLSNHDDESFAVKTVQMGAQDYLVKERVDRDVLARAIRYAIERHQMIKKLEQAQGELQKIARYDSLTGLSNRNFFYEQLDKLIERVRRENKLMAVMFLDLDNFKPVNDEHGHSVGDLLLQSVAKRITSCLRKNDIAARLGGDEFIIAYDTSGNEESLAIAAQRIIEVISDVYILSGQELKISASIGVSVYPKDGVDMDVLIKNADTAMYSTKEDGGNNYNLFISEMRGKQMVKHSTF
ncbi:MAG: diguanylate cyclase response regulator [Candidatus Scalindua sp.]|nr:diguanylate cyclase response regulator [Candidatus Scalindua sp.]